MKHLSIALLFSLSTSASAASPETAAQAMNALGLDLHRQMPKEGNVCLSPYSIESALGMTYLGASGATQEEMARVLHLPKDKAALGESFAALNAALVEAQEKSAKQVAQSKKYGGPSEALKLHVANRLFGQKGYEFRASFLSGVKSHFGAPMELMNFMKDHTGATREINGWVEKQTQKRIRDLIPENGLSSDTRLVLVNALYFKAAWAEEFGVAATGPKPFHVNGAKSTVQVPTMRQQEHLRYLNGAGFQSVTLPYAGHDLHFLLIVPDDISGVSDVEKKLTPETLLACAKAEHREVILHLPKFKITPPTVPLGEVLQKMGMTTAFDKPQGSADFDAMAPKKPDDYLAISEVFHKTFIELDEKGTEAAAATAVAMVATTAMPVERAKPVELKADRPFLFAIQHAQSGACLFLGRVSDPR
ncbi:serpin family protein [Prosthecobacter sp.]|jgi:serpin B|uniref:serpin family protein n=1 Tax=Prosthecobacter sp. TaxID=1965333 RepID=UPI003783ED38